LASSFKSTATLITYRKENGLHCILLVTNADDSNYVEVPEYDGDKWILGTLFLKNYYATSKDSGQNVSAFVQENDSGQNVSAFEKEYGFAQSLPQPTASQPSMFNLIPSWICLLVVICIGCMCCGICCEFCGKVLNGTSDVFKCVLLLFASVLE